jgi:hypothetical protein
VNGGTNAFRAKASTANSGDTIATFENNAGIVTIIRANGRFGIGALSPATALEVGRNAAGTPSGITITGGSTVAPPVLYFNYADAPSNLKRWMLFGDINGGFNVGTQPDAGGPASPKLFISNSGNVGKPLNETFTDKRVFSDGERTVELDDIGPSPHVEEMVIAYLPQQKIVFVSDLCITRIKGRMPPRSHTDEDFAQKISRLNLQVETIANGHGWIGPMAEFLRHVETPSR